MNDRDTALAPARDDAALLPALRKLDLPDRLLQDLAHAPDQAGEVLLEFVAGLSRAGSTDQARRVLETLRAYPPTLEDRQYASIELSHLLQQSGEEQAVAEAERITAELLSPGGLSEGPAELLAEDLEARGRLADALRCLNLASRDLLAEPAEVLEGAEARHLTALIRRSRVRAQLGMELDAHDEVAVASARRLLAQTYGDEQVDAARPESPEPDRAVEALYSRQAFDEARARGLLTAEAAEHGADAYYRAADRDLREQGRQAPETRWYVALHGVAEIEAFAEQTGSDPADRATVLSWSETEITVDDPRLVPWPPQRNETCWCGSARKYKKCCGSPSNR
ncbi:SEC-C motif-containing protein [Nocardiopsis sp. Huas11]|uniref:SEC-C domain-containing protein n=1 Tax=Nocardiopsis sp. Huas11 TaxID=2183912 RepID=UPI000EB22C30|nr:SEC-C metal-binding domain-containing protein [Nocardiopsis sp. Huas11]RKS08181.1 SEC-C motif-containing protein [Nocardiopsis sp. Huas11]